MSISSSWRCSNGGTFFILHLAPLDTLTNCPAFISLVSFSRYSCRWKHHITCWHLKSTRWSGNSNDINIIVFFQYLIDSPSVYSLLSSLDYYFSGIHDLFFSVFFDIKGLFLDNAPLIWYHSATTYPTAAARLASSIWF